MRGIRRRKVCDRPRYPSLKAARGAIAARKAEGHESASYLEPHYCGLCSGYHIGHRNNAFKRYEGQQSVHLRKK